MSTAGLVDDAFKAFAGGRHREAANLARRCLEQDPDEPGARLLLGRLALAAGHPDTAHHILARLVTTHPGVAAPFLDLAQALRELGRPQEAAEAAGYATSLDARNTAAWVRLGEIMLSLGDGERAAAAFRSAWALDTGCVAALRGICLAESIEPGMDVAVRMQELIDDPAVPVALRAGLHYSLAQVHRSAGDRAGFVRHLFAANALQRSLSQEGRAEYAARFDRLEAAFTRDAFAGFGKAAICEPSPIFVLGMPRSGTTLVERLLSGHAGVAAGGELDYVRGPLRQAIERLTGQPFPTGFAGIGAQARDELARGYARRLRLIGPESQRVTDKTPGNFHVLGLLRALFPRGSVIHVRREPMDTCFSILQYQFDDRSPHTCDMALLAYAYARYARLMERWQDLFGDGFNTVAYEDLVAAPAIHARRIADHCGLAWDDSCLEPGSSRGAVRTFSMAQVRRPIYTTSVGAWREFEAELQPMHDALRAELSEKLD